VNQNRGTAGTAPAPARLAGPPAAPGAGVALGLPEDPLSRRASRHPGRPGGRPARLAGTPALLLLASLIVSLLAASSAPTPLYAIYQQRWGFSPITTTIVFGVYALAVLASLLTLGRLSDYGRAPDECSARAPRRPIIQTGQSREVIEMGAKTTAGPSARERLLEAASELFYDEGVHTVGIDRVIERAGVAKASLYNTFGSKDELVRAYLEGRHAVTSARITRYLERYSDPRDRLLGVFEAQGELFAEPGFRGCAFVSASAESPGEAVSRAADDYRGWVRGLLTGLAREAGAPDPGKLGRQLHLIYDGASLSARMDHDPSAAVAARAAAEALLDAAPAAGCRP
jgi:AcrR family transcriptional regulator